MFKKLDQLPPISVCDNHIQISEASLIVNSIHGLLTFNNCNLGDKKNKLNYKCTRILIYHHEQLFALLLYKTNRFHVAVEV